jgi:hypothetical protein
MLFCFLSVASFFTQFFQYFRINWIGNDPSSNDLIQRWNAFDASDFHTTNNAIEGWHNGFHQQMGTHSQIWRFIVKLQTHQCQMESELAAIRLGGSANRPQKKYVSIKLKLARLKVQFQQGRLSVHHYLLAVSNHLYEGNVKPPRSAPAGFPIHEDEAVVAARYAAFPILPFGATRVIGPIQSITNGPLLSTPPGHLVVEEEGVVQPQPQGSTAVGHVALPRVTPSLEDSSSQPTASTQIASSQDPQILNDQTLAVTTTIVNQQSPTPNNIMHGSGDDTETGIFIFNGCDESNLISFFFFFFFFF